MKRLSICALILLCAAPLACGRKDSLLAPPPPTPQLWYWQHSLVNGEAGLQTSRKLTDRARAAGYTGVAFWDVSFSYLTSPRWPDHGGRYLKRAMDYAVAQGMQVLALGPPFGYSNDVLNFNPNWAEGQRVEGARFKVDDAGRLLRLIDSFSGLANSGFESGATGWFNNRDRGVDVDSSTSHTGSKSGVINNAPGNGRFSQLLTLTPWRQYHLRLFLKSRAYAGPPPVVEVFDAGSQAKLRQYQQIKVAPTQDWMQVDATFNSQSSSSAWLYFGVWGGGNTGTLWFDDVSVEETALVYLIRRSGAPLKVYDPSTGAVFREAVDFDPIKDSGLTGDPHDDYHAPPPVTLPSGTTLKPGQTVAMDFYAALPVELHRLGICLTDPAVQEFLMENARQVMAVAPPQTGMFLQYDEMRQMDSCQSCRAKGMTPGQLLAWHVGQTIKLYRSLRPGLAFYAWSDMFDPFANAHDDYYLVEGDIGGSWLGLPPEVTIMNWNLDHLKESLAWFSGEDSKQPIAHRQIIAGYYDNHNGQVAASGELRQAHGIPGIDGLMYTSWEDDNSQLEEFADSARKSWNDYRSSVVSAP